LIPEGKIDAQLHSSQNSSLRQSKFEYLYLSVSNLTLISLVFASYLSKS